MASNTIQVESSKSKQSHKTWPPEVEKKLIDILVDEVNKGSIENGVFSPNTWNDIVEALKESSGREFSMTQLKQKYQRLKQNHTAFSMLLENTGFGWDSETNIVTALEETWQNHLRKHKNAAQFRKKGCKHYKLLEIFFNKSTATGVLRHASTQSPPNTDEERELDNEFLNVGVYIDVDLDSQEENIVQEDTTMLNVTKTSVRTTRSGKRYATQDHRKNKKEPKTHQMGEALQALADAAKARMEVSLAKVDRIRTKTVSMEATSSVTSSGYSISKCITSLDELGCINNATYVKALEKFTNPDWREIFITLTVERKKAWLDSLV